MERNEHIGKMYVVGISVRTSNQQFQQEALPLWDRFIRENMGGMIKGRLNQKLLAVYTDYEGDYTKPFSYLIGCEVSNLENIPSGMIGMEIPTASYQVFTAHGEFPQSMLVAWQKIWNFDNYRAYTTDFEVYPADFNPQNNPQIDIFIAIK
jgi:predicted transcriptional regulator YdeE